MLSCLHGLLAWSSLYSVTQVEIEVNIKDEYSPVTLVTEAGRQRIASVSNDLLLRDIRFVIPGYHVSKIVERKKVRTDYSKHSRFVYRINNYPVVGTSTKSVVQLTDIKLLNPIIETAAILA